MKASEIKNKSDAELKTLLDDNRKQLSQLAIDARIKRAADVKQIRMARKVVARVLTTQRERQIAGEAPPPTAAPKEETNG